ncbi:hypothetical protein TRFO_28323 [Tritrichomonas foetus]|uniref:Uncharacterized protein n=1 Tax=Tritrichomonas foetus TaxID=1144522 RepID=A0A1J4JZ16_9EUKA|nr:hypothetical protein TRFO_28323 [Tritrichomonas foetus]|eukprot:OHT04219.1 hypothetical protein TRFO_28323 [Tritrichomonas foetus]
MESIEDLIKRRISPILIYDNDPEIESYLSNTHGISLKKLIIDNGNEKFRSSPLNEFREQTPADISRTVKKAFKKFGSIFLNPDFFKSFSVTYPEGFHEAFPNYLMSSTFPLDNFIKYTPWFRWLQGYAFDAIKFSRGMLLDLPFCFLFVYPTSKIAEVGQLKHTVFSRDHIPNILNYPDSADNRKFYQSNARLALVLVKRHDEPEVKYPNSISESFQSVAVFSEENFEDDFSHFVQQLYKEHFITPHEELRKIIEKANAKKRPFSRNPSPMNMLTYAVQCFSMQNFSETLEYLAKLDDKQNCIINNFYFVNFMKTISKLMKISPTEEINEFYGALNKLIEINQNNPMPFKVRILHGVLLFSFIENVNFRVCDFKIIFNRLVRLTITNQPAIQQLLEIVCGVWYDQIAVLYYRSDQKRKVAMNLLMAAKTYGRCAMKGHMLRCYAFLQAILSKSFKTSSATFACGRVSNNVYLPLPKSWQSLGNYALWQLSKTLAITRQYKSALQLNIILLAAPKSELVPDRKIFSVLHAYFNCLNIGRLTLENLPLVLIDNDRVKFAEYGGFTIKNYNQAEFEHLLQHHRKKFKVVRDNLSMWRKSRQGDDFKVPIVCGEKSAIIIPLTNMRSADINLSDLSLVDSDKMVTSSCEKNELIIKSNELTIPINFITNKTGPFSITGIRFIYWAILEDTLKLSPFKFVALDNQPSLEATLINFPEVMSVGECASFTCRLKNFGSAEMPNVVFVHDAPYSIAFQNVRDWRMSGGAVSVSLLSTKLQPGESVDVPCFIRGRVPGQFNLKMIFTFLANQPLRWRIFPDKRTITVVSKEQFVSKVLNHPLSNSKKLIYINGTTAENEAIIKSVTLLGCRTFAEQDEEVIPPNSALSCVREVEIYGNDESSNNKNKTWREQFLNREEKGFIEVDTKNELRAQFNISNEPSSSSTIVNTSENKNDSKNCYKFRGALQAPSIIKSNDQDTIEVLLLLKNVGNRETPPFIVTPKGNPSGQFFWVSKISEKMKPLKPGEEVNAKFFLFVCEPGVYDIGHFGITFKNEKCDYHFTHILSVY